MEIIAPIDNFRAYHLVSYLRLIESYTIYLLNQVSQGGMAMTEGIIQSERYISNISRSLVDLHNNEGDQLFQNMLKGFKINYNFMEASGGVSPITVRREEMIGLEETDDSAFVDRGLAFLNRIFETPDGEWVSITQNPDEWCKVSCLFATTGRYPSVCVGMSEAMAELDAKTIFALLALSSEDKWKSSIRATSAEAPLSLSIQALLLKDYNFLIALKNAIN